MRVSTGPSLTTFPSESTCLPNSSSLCRERRKSVEGGKRSKKTIRNQIFEKKEEEGKTDAKKTQKNRNKKIKKGKKRRKEGNKKQKERRRKKTKRET